MSDFVIGLLVGTGGIFWLLAFAWLVGVIAKRLGLVKSYYS